MKRLKQNGMLMVLVGCGMLAMITINGCKKEDPKPVVSVPVNKAPVAKAGDDRQVEIGSTVKLDASGSSDTDGDVLTYNWSFISKPQRSQAVITGVGKEQAEFTFDRAGKYVVLLSVKDGKIETTDSVIVENRTPIIYKLYKRHEGRLGEKYFQIGKQVIITGDYFGAINEDVSVSIGGIDCEIEYLYDDGDGMQFVIADSVMGGDLQVTVGSLVVKWTTPIQIIKFPLESFINDNPFLKGRVTTNKENVEIGTRFKPLLNGELIGVSLKLSSFGTFEVNIWDAETKLLLGSKAITINNTSRVFYSQLNTPIELKKDKEYVVSVNAVKWYLYTNPSGSGSDNIIFPKTYDYIQLLRTDYKSGSTKAFPDDASAFHYIARSAGIIFSPDF